MLRSVRRPSNVGASVRDRLLNRAREEKADFQLLLTRYALERLLYRLSISSHRNRFVLKGAMLLVALVEDKFRPTRDLDLMGFGKGNVAEIADVFRGLCAEGGGDDGVVFDAPGLRGETIREESAYGGVRVRATAMIAGARIPIQVDVGFGEVVTPGPVEIEYPTLLDGPRPLLRAYPIETVVAEKCQALVSLGIVNSRLKDYYDLWLISRTFEFELRMLGEAVRNTFERRKTMLPSELPVGLTVAYAGQWGRQWEAFMSRERMAAAPASLEHVLQDLRVFLMPLLAATDRDDRWIAGGPWTR